MTLPSAFLALVLLSAGAPPSPKTVALSKAVEEGDLESIKKLVSEGVDVDAAYLGDTPVTRSLNIGKESVAAYLLEHGAKPNAESPKGDRPLGRAIAASSRSEEAFKLVRKLLDMGADVNPPTDIPLFSAVDIVCDSTGAARGKQIVDWLLANKAQIDRGPLDMSPLNAAVSKKCVEGVKLLLAKGANPNLPDAMGQSLVETARERGAEDIAKIIQQAQKKKR